MSEGHTLADYKARLAKLRSMRRDVDCPNPDCDEGWVVTRACAGYICDWEGHTWEESGSTTHR